MSIQLKQLLDEGASDFDLRLVAGGKGLSRTLTSPRIQKPGLLLTGLLEELHPDRVQIFGAAEIGYLDNLEADKRKVSLAVLDRAPIPAIVVTRGLRPPAFLVDLADRKGIPVFSTSLTSSLLIERLTRYLEEKLAPVTTMHGVLVDVLGIGVLIIGKSGIGKSECALDLITRGYRLVADDVVIVRKMANSTLLGVASDVIRYHMEIRGLGIVNIKDIFGITAIRRKKQLDIVVELVRWEPDGAYDRLGFEEARYEILGVELTHLKIPVSPGRSVATIVEVAARNQILKIMGYNPSGELEAHLDSLIRRPEKAGH